MFLSLSFPSAPGRAVCNFGLIVVVGPSSRASLSARNSCFLYLHFLAQIEKRILSDCSLKRKEQPKSCPPTTTPLLLPPLPLWLSQPTSPSPPLLVTRYRAWGAHCVPGTRLGDVIQREEGIDPGFKEPVVGRRRQKSHRSNFNYLHLLH